MDRLKKRNNGVISGNEEIKGLIILMIVFLVLILLMSRAADLISN
ncbi:MAG: hypothetical protein N2510_05875 [Ignavibacteria bacterium]|nr:hypothetical protein [Ignavibacteria bacterium]